MVNTNDITQEIKQRIITANRTLFRLSKILRHKIVRRNTKLKIYKTLILPVLAYGAQSWTMSERATVFEKKILRMIFGAVCDPDS